MIQRPDRALILAAGLGSRLDDGRSIPKPLRKVAGVPLIVRVIRALEEGGVRSIGIVVGHLAEDLRRGLERFDYVAELSFYLNDEYHKPNGTSVLKARSFVEGPTLLSMSDHLWSADLLASVASYPLAPHESVLGVDYRIDECFDLEDATKVLVRDDRILEIGKALEQYNALDTGLFSITPALVEALETVEGPHGCSLSQGVATLAKRGHMRAADVGEAAWIDVDTPHAHAEAERLIAERGEHLGGSWRPSLTLANSGRQPRT